MIKIKTARMFSFEDLCSYTFHTFSTSPYKLIVKSILVQIWKMPELDIALFGIKFLQKIALHTIHFLKEIFEAKKNVKSIF